jgi:hypothetical protein
MIDPKDYGSERTFVRDALNELYKFNAIPFVSTADIDLVWSVSSMSTVKEPGNVSPDSPYSGNILWDRDLVDNAVRIVREVTALRLGKSVEKVNTGDIEASGPTLLYNGATPDLPNTNFPKQNQHFEELVSEPDFPIPRSKIVIGKLEGISTPFQVRQIARYLREQPNLHKVVVVCGLPHTIRLGRYIEHFIDQFPGDVSFVAAPVEQGDYLTQSAIVALEIQKAIAYKNKGDLAVKSIFFPDGVPGERSILGDGAGG